MLPSLLFVKLAYLLISIVENEKTQYWILPLFQMLKKLSKTPRMYFLGKILFYHARGWTFVEISILCNFKEYKINKWVD